MPPRSQFFLTFLANQQMDAKGAYDTSTVSQFALQKDLKQGFLGRGRTQIRIRIENFFETNSITTRDIRRERLKAP
jgi:hypothetical protein